MRATLDVQFYQVIHHLTDLKPKQIYDVFDMLDTDGSGKIDFDEFYLLFCILVAHKVCSYRTHYNHGSCCLLMGYNLSYHYLIFLSLTSVSSVCTFQC